MSETVQLDQLGAVMDGQNRIQPSGIRPVYCHPDDVLADPALSPEDKRALLAEWISDRQAVPDQPALRQLENGALVSVDQVLQALRSLDEAEPPLRAASSGPGVPIPFPRRRKAMTRPVGLRPSDPEDDDDPPPGGTSARIPIWISTLAA